jgi:hypothetical protein
MSLISASRCLPSREPDERSKSRFNASASSRSIRDADDRVQRRVQLMARWLELRLVLTGIRAVVFSPDFGTACLIARTTGGKGLAVHCKRHPVFPKT